MKYILIIAITFSGGLVSGQEAASTAIKEIHFGTQASCEYAAADLIKQAKAALHKGTGLLAVCYPE